jgi:hypothetical protein
MRCANAHKGEKEKMRYGRRNQYPGNGPFRDLPPFKRPGYLYGYGGRGFMGTDPTKCARFPWLSRWWWTNSEITDSPTIAPSSEKEFLENQLEYMAKEMEHIKNRIEDLGKTETQ